MMIIGNKLLQTDNWILNTCIDGARIKLPPSDWVTPPPDVSKYEPKFEDVDNP